jgi:hypothetical protein
VNFDDSIVVHSTVTSSSSSGSNSSVIEADVSITFVLSSSNDVQSIAQEVLISFATQVFTNAFSLESEPDASSWTIVPALTENNNNCLTASTTTGDYTISNFLSRPADEIKGKKRLYSSNEYQVWEYSTPMSAANNYNKVISVFVNQVLRFTTATAASIIHAEALVHPAMISHPNPKRVLVVSDVPIAILNELQKYDSSIVELIDVAFTKPDCLVTREVLHIIERYMVNIQNKGANFIPITYYNNLDHLPNLQESDDEPLYQFEDLREQESIDYTNPEKNIHQMPRSICHDEKVALENKRAGNDWERHLLCGKNTIQDLQDDDEEGEGSGDDGSEDEYDVILMDIPSYLASDWLSIALHQKLKGLLETDNGILAISIGSPPNVNDFISAAKSSPSTPFHDCIGSLPNVNEFTSAKVDKEHEMSSRDTFLRQAARHKRNNGIGYKHIAVYDEPLASPLASAFLMSFTSMLGDSYARFYRSNSAAIDIDVIHRLLPKGTTTGVSIPPTVIYDGSTHMHYKIPTRNWEIWYCSTPPGMYASGCSFFRSDIFNQQKHHKGVEVRKHPVKGRAVYATESMAINEFVNFDDTASLFNIDPADWKALNKFIENYPEATKYKDLRDWIFAYGFETLVIGMTGWSVSIASVNTFVNHACSEEEVKTAACDFIFVNEDNEPSVAFSPIINRHPFMASAAQCIIRSINAGDEVAMDYSAFVGDASERPYFQMLLTDMCQSGQGVVLGDKDQPKSEL